MYKSLVIFISLLVLSGCVANRQYQWGNYENALYAGYHDQTKFEEMMVELESHISTLEQGGIKVPPGLYAELGTLYLQSGKKDDAMTMYQKEKNAWPESGQLMTALIDNLKRMEKSSQTAIAPTDSNKQEGQEK